MVSGIKYAVIKVRLRWFGAVLQYPCKFVVLLCSLNIFPWREPSLRIPFLGDSFYLMKSRKLSCKMFPVCCHKTRTRA